MDLIRNKTGHLECPGNILILNLIAKYYFYHFVFSTNVSELIDNFPRLPQYLGDNHTYLVTEKPNFLDVEIEKYSIGKEVSLK